MKVTRFQNSDYPQIVEWCEKHDKIAPKLSYLPMHGLIVKDVAAGFLYVASGKLGILDGFVTNPDAEPQARNEALNLIIEVLVAHADDLRLPRVVGITTDSAIVSRGCNLGFVTRGNNWTILQRECK